MFALEERISRELYWVGFGFQIWCQLDASKNLWPMRRQADSILTC